MDMSVNPDGMNTVDYSDFEYQQAYFSHTNDTLSGDDATSIVNFDIDVLEGAGGLNNNEVAELVYTQAFINVEHLQSDDDQDVGSETQIRGVFGANLPNSRDLLPYNGANPDSTVLFENNATAATDGSVDSESRVFFPYQTIKQPSFDDETNGTGGAGGNPTMLIERPWRQLTGRGPVLDASDSLNLTNRLVQEDEIISADANIAIHMIWDVAETSDAGRAFSVPKDM